MKQEILINRYLDNEATVAERELVNKLLLSDKEFSSAFKKMQETNLLLNKIENVIVPDDIYKRVLSSVKHQGSRQPFYIRLAPALAGSLLSFILGIFLTTFLFTNQVKSPDTTSSDSLDDIYTTLELNDVLNYYYD